MNIIVCIKQVPDTAEISIDPATGTLNRAGVESIINPLDLHALEAAIKLKTNYGGTVTALSMGPNQTEEALLEAVAMGADSGILCTDKKFAGADTWATANTLQAAVRYLGMPDIIFCGKQAIDGDTAQVPAELAIGLDIPFLPYVDTIEKIRDGKIRLKSMTDNGFSIIEAAIPVVCSVVKSINVPRLISLAGWVRAFSSNITRVSREDLDLSTEVTGLNGSPTRVKKITPVSHSKSVKYLDADREEDIAVIYGFLRNASDFDPDLIDTGSGAVGGISPSASLQFSNLTIGNLTILSSEHPIIMVLGETDPVTHEIHRVTYELLGEATRLADLKGGVVAAVLPLFKGRSNIAESVSVYCLDFSGDQPFEPNFFAKAITGVIRKVNPEIILAPATMAGRAYVPLVAALLKTGLTADCTHFDIDPATGLLLQTRPAFGGNIMATIITPSHSPQMATVRPHVLKIPEPIQPGLSTGTSSCAPNMGGYYRVRIDDAGVSGREISVLEESSTVKNSEDISNASVIIGGGRGIGAGTGGGSTGFPLLTRLAALIGASVGASRSAVEAGWAPYHQQVGQTGKTVQPKLYLACGISGAVQHLVGMHDSDTIIAINSDPDAPIFQAADYGFVDDYTIVIRKLINLVQTRREGGA